MTVQKMQYVAIIGGFYHMHDPVMIAKAHKTANELGEALARAGMGLVVYFSDANSLEPHVVSGYVKATPAGTGKGSIRVRFAESQKNMVVFAEQATRSDLFQRVLFPGQDWEAPFYRSLVDAEGVSAVLLMAGGRSTLIAGQIAIARPLPVLAVDEYDGAAGVIRTELATGAKDYPSSSTHSITEMVGWLKKKCVARAEQQRQARNIELHYQKIVSQRTKTFWALGALLALAITFGFGVAQKPPPETYPLVTFISLVVAGATGALVRAVYWGAKETPPLTSLLLGAFSVVVVGFAYLVPQWVGAPGVLESSALEVLATDKIQFVSATLVAISAGVGFDTVVNRLKKQADDLSINPQS